METRQQYRSSAWFSMRAGRVTASQVHAVCTFDINKPAATTVKGVCYPAHKKVVTPAVSWGLENEDRARDAYKEQAKKTLWRSCWVWCKSRGIWLTVSHIPGKSNVEADTRSRIFNDRKEWQLNHIFERLTKRFGTPDVDLFASRLNYQIKPFVSWGPDPESWAVDAFSINWGNTYSYAFPPFSLLNRVLNKLRRDQADGMIIAPYWTTASWFPVLVDMLTSPPVLLPQGSRVLRLPHNAVHPLHRQLQLMACN